MNQITNEFWEDWLRNDPAGKLFLQACEHEGIEPSPLAPADETATFSPDNPYYPLYRQMLLRHMLK